MSDGGTRIPLPLGVSRPVVPTITQVVWTANPAGSPKVTDA